MFSHVCANQICTRVYAIATEVALITSMYIYDYTLIPHNKLYNNYCIHVMSHCKITGTPWIILQRLFGRGRCNGQRCQYPCNFPRCPSASGIHLFQDLLAQASPTWWHLHLRSSDEQFLCFFARCMMTLL